MLKKRQGASCYRCAHFYVTWDPAFPRGCRAMGFKGRELPAETVLRASGMTCQLYADQARPGRS